MLTKYMNGVYVVHLAANLRNILEKYAVVYDESYVSTDPIKFPRRYLEPLDQECVAFISAVFAFGNVTSIFKTLEAIFAILGEHPHERIRTWQAGDHVRLRGIKHRWITEKDLHVFFLALAEVYTTHGSIEGLFAKALFQDVPNPVERGLSHLYDEFQVIFKKHVKTPTRGLIFLVSSPLKKSVCKRMNLFLRWVVRKPAPDLGLWRCLEAKDLLLPMDTHLARIVSYIGLIPRKTKSYHWKTVVKATQGLSSFDPVDPIKYDFSLSRLGILKICRHKYVKSVCQGCGLKPFCCYAKSK